MKNLSRSRLRRQTMDIVAICFLCLMRIFIFSAHASENTSDARYSTPDVMNMSLTECIKYAVNNSFEIKLAKLDLYISGTGLMYSEAVFDAFLYGGMSYSEDKRQQVSVFASDDNQENEYYLGVEKILPSGTELAAEIKDTRSWSNSAFVSKNPNHGAELVLEAKQPLGKNCFGYVDRNTITLTRLAIKNAELDMRDRIEDLIARTEKAYLDLVYAKESVEIYHRMREKAQKLYQTNKDNFDIGLVEKVDLLASGAHVASVKAETLLSENNYARAEEDLKLIMNISGDIRIIPTEELNLHRMDKELADCLKEAFEKRRDYRSKKRDVEIKGVTLKIKYSEKWPEIDLTASIATNGLERDFKRAAGKITVADNVYYCAGIEVRIPIENKSAGSEYDQAKHEKEKAIIELKKTERMIITEVGNAYGDVVTFERSLIYKKREVDLQSEKLAEEEKRFNSGRSSTKRLIDCQQDLLMSELENARSLLRVDRAMVDLEQFMNIILAKYEDIL